MINNLWHTSGTMTTARTPAVRPFINALGCQPENLAGNPPPITGSAVQANHFFTDSRVLDLMRQILN